MAELPNFVQNLVGFFSFKTKDIRFIMPVIDTFWLEILKSSCVYGKKNEPLTLKMPHRFWSKFGRSGHSEKSAKCSFALNSIFEQLVCCLFFHPKY